MEDIPGDQDDISVSRSSSQGRSYEKKGTLIDELKTSAFSTAEGGERERVERERGERERVELQELEFCNVDLKRIMFEGASAAKRLSEAYPNYPSLL